MGAAKKRLQYRYDARGNRSALVDHDGGRFTYSYDSVGRMTQVLNPQNQPTTFSYSDGGRRTLKRMSNGTRASFTYDPAGNLTKLYNLRTDGTVLSSFEYAYDKTGNRTRVLEAGGSRVTWTYDNTYQLTGEHRTGTTPYRDTYTYDAAGNRLLKNHTGARTTYSYDAANQLVYSQDATGRTTFTFDADGNQQVQREPSGDRTTYVWDYENRMSVARLPAGTRSTMSYEPEGLRVKLEEPTETKKFVWDELNYLAETDAANDTQAVYTNEPRTYGRLISQRRSTITRWFHFDAIGSTRQTTNGSAVVSDTRLYDAWGVQLASTGMTVFPFGYVGVDGYYTDTTGRLYVRARHLSVALARWLSGDPLGSVARQSLWNYALNNPLRATDPSGADICSCCNTAVADARQQYGFGLTIDGQVRTCPIEIECKEQGDCSTNGTPFPAVTSIDKNGVVHICISCKLHNVNLGGTLAHELQHARDLCDAPNQPPNLPNCIAFEKAACTEQCTFAQGGAVRDMAAFNRCVDCCIWFSCARFNQPPPVPACNDYGVPAQPCWKWDSSKGFIFDWDDPRCARNHHPKT